MGVTYGNKAIKVYTKTKHFKSGNTYNAKMYGVIEEPKKSLEIRGRELKYRLK